jgi:ferredoxin
MKKHKVLLRPSLETILVSEGANLLDELKSQNIYIKSSCGGHATCSDCVVKVVSGEDNLVPPTFDELKLLGNVFHITKERLLCQTKICGDISIDISKHDKATDEVKLKSKASKLRPTKKLTKVRSRDEVDKIKESRFSEKEERIKKDQGFFKHWEKNTENSGKNSIKKNLGGNDRPKTFNSDRVVEREKSNMNREERDYPRRDNRSNTQDERNSNNDGPSKFKKFRNED